MQTNYTFFPFENIYYFDEESLNLEGGGWSNK